MEMENEKKEEGFKDKIDKKLGVLLTYTNEGFPLASVPCKNFPFDFWKEWEQDCKQKFGGVRWMKMWHDHQKIHQFNLEIEVEMLKSALAEAVKEQQEKVQEKVDEGNPLGLLSGGK